MFAISFSILILDFVFQKVARRKQRVEKYARLWLDTTQQRKLDREIEKADQVRIKLFVKYFIRYTASEFIVEHKQAITTFYN